jgi:hypothetical protein
MDRVPELVHRCVPPCLRPTQRRNPAPSAHPFAHEEQFGRDLVPLQARRGGSSRQTRHALENTDADLATVLGRAALAIWGDLPRDIQETRFEAAIKGRDDRREALARLLHERHPRTTHPQWPA